MCTVWWRASLVTSFELHPSLHVCGFVFLCAGVTVSKDANYNTECAKRLYARLWLTWAVSNPIYVDYIIYGIISAGV